VIWINCKSSVCTTLCRRGRRRFCGTAVHIRRPLRDAWLE